MTDTSAGGGRRALAFLTALGGAAAPPSPAALRWFPVVGGALGLALGAVWWSAGLLWPPAVAAAVVVVADLALTGMLHFDGLVDSADGLLSHLPRTRRLEVMAEPTAGAFGIGAGAVVLLLRWSALAALAPSLLLLAGLWCASRSAMATATAFVPYARQGGLAESFLGKGGLAGGLFGSLAALVLATAGGGGLWALAVAAGLGAAGVVVAFGARRLGGFTGDVLGAAGMVGETVGLLVAAAR